MRPSPGGTVSPSAIASPRNRNPRVAGDTNNQNFPENAPRRDVTELLQAAAGGDGQAAEALLPLIYSELRAMAAARMAGQLAGQTLQPTALVHEAYIKLLGSRSVNWAGRRSFFGAAAMAMRDILVDMYRRRAAAKRGGGWQQVDLDAADQGEELSPELVLALNDALDRLEEQYPRPAEVVRLRFFAGLSRAETAAVLEVSEKAVERDWTLAKAWLRRALAEGDERNVEPA